MKKTRGYRVLLMALLWSATLCIYATDMEVKFTSSTGDPIPNGHVKYFENGWKNFGQTNEAGIATKNIAPGTYSFQLTYEGQTVERPNVNISEENPLIFQTVKMVVKLHSSAAEGLSGGEVEYKSPGWITFGTTGSGGGGNSSPGGGGCGTGGGTNKELLPGIYSFRMTYEGETITRSDVDIVVENPLVFTTVKMVVKLKDSQGGGLAGALVEFNSSGWKDFGITKNPGGGSSGGGCGGHEGEEGGEDEGCGGGGSGGSGGSGGVGGSDGGCGGDSGEEGGGCGEDHEEGDEGCGGGGSGGSGSGGSGGNDGGCGDEGGEDEGGCGGGGDEGGEDEGGCGGGGGNGGPGGNIHKELFPGTYLFRITWENASLTEANVNIEEESPLLFHTVKTIVKLVDVSGNGIEGGEVSYYRNEWKEAGLTNSSGIINLEFFPKEYTFSMDYNGVTMEKTLTVAAPETIVEFEWDGSFLKNSKPIEPESSVTEFYLYPNPAIGDVNLSLDLKEARQLDITIIDLSGKTVRQLFSGMAHEGNHQFTWNRKNDSGEMVETGVYLCRVNAGGKQTVKTIVLVK